VIVKNTALGNDKKNLRLKTSLFASPDVENLASNFNRYLLNNYHHGQTQITIKLRHLFDQNLTCQWLLVDDELLKTSATVWIGLDWILFVEFLQNKKQVYC